MKQFMVPGVVVFESAIVSQLIYYDDRLLAAENRPSHNMSDLQKSIERTLEQRHFHHLRRMLIDNHFHVATTRLCLRMQYGD
jgi:hypothetical protein